MSNTQNYIGIKLKISKWITKGFELDLEDFFLKYIGKRTYIIMDDPGNWTVGT